MAKSEIPAPVTFVLGGARSGKSLYAEGLFEGPGARLYLATAEAKDAEMTARIEEHKKRRGPDWQTIEEPLDVCGVLGAHSSQNKPILVDCLTLWLSNVMAAGLGVDDEIQALITCLGDLPGPVILVSNEVGQGIVPDNALARAYMDYAGFMNQAVARAAGRVILVSAGLPQVLKEE